MVGARLGSWSFGEHRVRFPRFSESSKSARATENEKRATWPLLKGIEGYIRATRGLPSFIKGKMNNLSGNRGLHGRC